MEKLSKMEWKKEGKIRTKIKKIFEEFLFGGFQSLPDKAYLTNSLSSSLVAINGEQTLSVFDAVS
jgi:hypothetical protein